MELSSIARFINSHVEVLIRTDHSVIYANNTEPDIILKAETIWIDGKPYGPPSRAAETSDDLNREYKIYMALGDHKSIPKYFGLIHDDNGKAISLKLERSYKGNLRHFIEDTSETLLTHKRLEMAIAFAKCVAHLHSCGVIWGDLSTRNTLVSDNNNIKICDFAGSALKPWYPQLGDYTYEPRYCPALPIDQVHALSMMQRELYALGSAIYEITEWKLPYAQTTGDIWDILERGQMPIIADDNVAQHIIEGCWNFRYDSVAAVVGGLASLSGRVKEE